MSFAPAVTEPSRVGIVLRSYMAAGAVALFFTCVDNYGFRYLGAPSPVLFVVLLFAAAVGLVLIEPRAPLPPLRSPFTLWLLAYFVVSTTWALWMSSSMVAKEALDTRYRSVGYVVALVVVFAAPAARRMAVLAMAAAVVFASLLNVAELLRIVQFEQDPLRVVGRSAGLYSNPNTAGMTIVLGTAIVIPRIPRYLHLPFVALAGLGVVTTFSRGAQVTFAVLVCVMIARGQLKVNPFAIAIAGIVMAAIALSLQTEEVFAFLRSRELVNERTLLRLQFAADDSGRTSLAMKAWRMFLSAPVLGKGLASTLDWDVPANSTHNQFLALAGEHGILGLLLFPALGAALVVRNPDAIPFAAALMLGGLVSHNMLQDRGYLLAIALAASYARDVGATAANEELADGTERPIDAARAST